MFDEHSERRRRRSFRTSAFMHEQSRQIKKQLLIKTPMQNDGVLGFLHTKKDKMLQFVIFFYKIIKKHLHFISKWNINTITNSKLGCRQVVRQRFLVSSFVGSNPATPARVQKSLEIATFSFIFKHLIWFEDKYILIAYFTTSSNSLLYFSIT